MYSGDKRVESFIEEIGFDSDDLCQALKINCFETFLQLVRMSSDWKLAPVGKSASSRPSHSVL